MGERGHTLKKTSKSFYVKIQRLLSHIVPFLIVPTSSQRGLSQKHSLQSPLFPLPRKPSPRHKQTEWSARQQWHITGTPARGQAGSALTATGQLSPALAHQGRTVTTHRKDQADKAASNGSPSKEHSVCKWQRWQRCASNKG